MCGRFTLTIEGEALSAAYGVERILVDHDPRYNIAPSQTVPVLLEDEDGRRIEGFRWGLVPGWAEDPSIGNRLINARSETVAEKPAFRTAWSRRQRCLVLADGFYEWQKPGSGKGPKTPHWVHMADRRPFGFAGLWERWREDGETLFSFTILTTSPNELVRRIHDRMPATLGDREAWERWIDREVPPDHAASLLGPYPGEEMHAQAVSTYVNRPHNEGPECVRPVADGASNVPRRGPDGLDPNGDRGPQADLFPGG